jgi:hypothetical protein
MKSYHMALGYVIFVIVTSTFIIWNVTSLDVSDCKWYIEDEWSFAPKEMREKAYQGCLETPYDQRENPKLPALFVLIGSLIPSGLYASYKTHSEWKKETRGKKNHA